MIAQEVFHFLKLKKKGKKSYGIEGRYAKSIGYGGVGLFRSSVEQVGL